LILVKMFINRETLTGTVKNELIYDIMRKM